MIDLEIYHAEGYFVSTWKMVPETSGRRALTRTGWKGTKNFVEGYPPGIFTITYNGVKYRKEDNEELLKKLFGEENDG